MKIEIDIPEGYEVDIENSTKECIKLKKIENKLPKTWKEFCKTHRNIEEEYYVSSVSRIASYCKETRNEVDERNLLPSKELAEAMLALCQLIQLRDCYNDGWKPDWTSDIVPKYSIFPIKGEIITETYWTANRILAFKTHELRDKFIENFKDLIETAKPLL